jgi:lipopolysaccharide cholinephosphotransferase
MEVSEKQRPLWNAIITDILREFIKICKENNLVYYCCGGTAIGAIRHHGIIPWDDDIDVFMPQPDYDRFIQITTSRDMGNYEVLVPRVDTSCPNCMTKMCNRRTTLLEFADIPFIQGLFIDIFPIDGAPDNVEEARKMEYCFRKLKFQLDAISAHYSFIRYVSLLKKRKEWGKFVWKTIGFLFRKFYRQHLLNKMKEIRYRYPYENSSIVAVYTGSYGPKEVFPKAWLDGIETFCFEGLKVNLPKGYDEYLRQYYGDYMQLPPEEKRIGHHQKAYFNLEAREADEIVFKKARQK